MSDSQSHGVKRGVLLLNNRVVIPEGLPGVQKVEQVVVTPKLRSASREEEYLRFAGELQVKVTYVALKSNSQTPEIKKWDPAGNQDTNVEKNFYDDGFSDHDEFAEEEIILLEEGFDPEQLNNGLETQTFEQLIQFTGYSPADSVESPETDILVPLVVDVELKLRDERVLDISAVVLLEEQIISRGEAASPPSGLEFRHPLFISSWPPGMAEILEWQVGFKAGEVSVRDNELLINGELVIQVIGVEKEGGDRDFTNVNTQSSVFWSLPIPPETELNSVTGIKVAISKVQEDSDGLAVLGSIYLDIAPVSSPEQLETGQFQPQHEFTPDNPMPPEEPIMPALADQEMQDCSLAWLKDWADGQCKEAELSKGMPEGEWAVPVNIIKEEQDKLLGMSSEDINPSSLEFFSKLDMMLGEIPTLEEVMADFTNRDHPSFEQNFQLNHRVNEAIPTEGSPRERRSLTQLKYINQETLSGQIAVSANDKSFPRRKSLTPGKVIQNIRPTEQQLTTQLPVPELLIEPETSSRKALSRTEFIQAYRGQEKVTGAKPLGTWKLYIVQPGDSLGGVCQRYGVDAEVVKARNRLSDQVLEPGTTVWIPK
ncbi:MAG: LysM peptidoglycan-binding domain-containing protein [Carboxydocellales bacterium]